MPLLSLSFVHTRRLRALMPVAIHSFMHARRMSAIIHRCLSRDEYVCIVYCVDDNQNKINHNTTVVNPSLH